VDHLADPCTSLSKLKGRVVKMRSNRVSYSGTEGELECPSNKSHAVYERTALLLYPDTTVVKFELSDLIKCDSEFSKLARVCIFLRHMWCAKQLYSSLIFTRILSNQLTQHICCSSEDAPLLCDGHAQVMFCLGPAEIQRSLWSFWEEALQLLSSTQWDT